MGEEPEEYGRYPGASANALQTAIERLEEAIEALDQAKVPLASAYVDLAMSLCFREWEKRMAEGG